MLVFMGAFRGAAIRDALGALRGPVRIATATACPLRIRRKDDDVVAQYVFAQKGGLLPVHVLANQVDERDDPRGSELDWRARDTQKRGVEPIVFSLVLFRHDRCAGGAPGVDRG